MKKALFLSLILFLTACSKIMVQKVESNTSLKGKIFYLLPANTIDFAIKVKQEKFKMGQLFKTNCTCSEFIKAGTELLGLDESVLNSLKDKGTYSSFSMVENQVEWAEGAIADTTKAFVFMNKGSWYKNNGFSLAYNSDWMVSHGTVSSENKSFEMATSFLSTAVSIASSVLKSGNPSGGQPLKMETVCKGALKQLALLKADYEKFQISPRANLNPEALQMVKAAMLKQIEKEIEALFYSKTETVNTIRFSLYLSQIFNRGKAVNLFKIRPDNGKVIFNEQIKDDIIWPLDSKQFLFEDGSRTSTYYSLTAIEDKLSMLNKVPSGFVVIEPKVTYGIIYNVPKNMMFYLKNSDDDIIKESRFPIAQFGAVNSLDQRLTKIDFTLDSLTGRLIKFDLESKALITSDRIKTAGSLLPQADSVFRKSKPTVVKQLEDEVKELELRVKKKEAEAKLN